MRNGVLGDKCLEGAEGPGVGHEQLSRIGGRWERRSHPLTGRRSTQRIQLVTIIKSLTAREVFRRCPGVKKKLWGGEFWSDGYFAGTVGRQGNERTIGAYVKQQSASYQKLHEDRQLVLF